MSRAAIFRNKAQGHGIDAIAQAGGSGAVVKDMAQVLAAAGEYFSALIAEEPVIFEDDIVFIQSFPKTRPASAGFEFVTGMEDW